MKTLRSLALVLILLLCRSGFGQTDTAAAKIAPFFDVPETFREDYGNYQSVLKFRDGRDVTTPEQWRERRTELGSEWTALLGQWPPLITRVSLFSNWESVRSIG